MTLPPRTSRNSNELPVRRLDGSRIAPTEHHLEGATGPAGALTLAATGLVAMRALACRRRCRRKRASRYPRALRVWARRGRRARCRREAGLPRLVQPHRSTAIDRGRQTALTPERAVWRRPARLLLGDGWSHPSSGRQAALIIHRAVGDSWKPARTAPPFAEKQGPRTDRSRRLASRCRAQSRKWRLARR